MTFLSIRRRAFGVLPALIALNVFAVAQDKPKPQPDVVVFMNGDQLTGMVERGVNDGIVFKSDMAGELTIPIAKIKELHSNGSFALLKKNVPPTKANVREGTIAVDAGKLTLSPSSGVEDLIDPATIGFIIDKPTYDKELTTRPGFFHGWSGSVSGGASTVQSTQYGSTFNLGAAIVRQIPTVPYLPPRDRTIINVTESYGTLSTPVIPQTNPPSPTQVVKTSLFHTDGEQDRYFSPRFYVLGTYAFDHNYASGLQLQQLYGGGFGLTVFNTPKHELDLKTDVHYEKQEFQDPTTNQNLIGSTFSESYRRSLPRSISLTETVSLLPAWNQLRAYSGNGAVTLAAPIFKRLSINFTASDAFINDPSPGYRKNTFQYITGITYNLK